MELGERIKALRLEKSLTQKELGKYLDVSEMSVRCWEYGTKNPSMSAIVALAHLFGVSTDYLLGVTVDESRDNLLLNKQEKVLLSNYRVLDKHGRKAVDTLCLIEKSRVEAEAVSQPRATIIQMPHKSPSRYIPRYTTPSAAGYSVPLDGEDFEMVLVDEPVPADADFAVGIQGNSMSPYIHDGDTVYVKKDCDLEVGDVGIFCVDGAMYCKQYYIDEERNLTLVSANPRLKHTNVFVGANSDAEVRCYGKVILNCRVELPNYLFE